MGFLLLGTMPGLVRWMNGLQLKNFSIDRKKLVHSNSVSDM